MPVDYRTLAGDILTKVGGEANVASLSHCATRLRFKLKDPGKASKAAVEKLPGVITVMEAGGQFQVVIGNDVPNVYGEIGKISKLTGDGAVANNGPKGNLFNQFIDMISKIFSPILWTLAGAGLLKALLELCTTVGWLDAKSQSYTILFAAADALFTFLPIILAVTAAKRFNANQFTSMAIAGALVYPSIIALNSAGAPVSFFGIPVVLVSYTSSVVPIIVAVWVQSIAEKWLKKVLPSVIRNFTTPLLVLLVMVPLTLIVVGPITSYLATWVSAGISWVFHLVPWLGGALMGGLWQVLVIFGLHWGFIPIFANDLGTMHFSLLMGPLPAAVLAQAAAATAVMIRTHNAKIKQVAGPAAISGFIAGITEPAIYGVNLPLRRPFYFGLAGGAIGGAIAAAGGSAANAFVMPGLLTLPAYIQVGSFALQVVGCVVAIAVAFTLTLVVGFKDPVEEADDATAPVLSASEIKAPVAGDLVALTAVHDKVFASGALGKGVGIVPADGQVFAPIEGTLVSDFPTGHAFGIKSADGVEVLIHLGIDTVQLNGKGFTSAVTRDQHVAPGDLLATVDLAAVKAAGYDPTTVLVVTNSAQFAAVLPAEGHRVGVGDTVIVIEH